MARTVNTTIVKSSALSRLLAPCGRISGDSKIHTTIPTIEITIQLIIARRKCAGSRSTGGVTPVFPSIFASDISPPLIISDSHHSRHVSEGPHWSAKAKGRVAGILCVSTGVIAMPQVSHASRSRAELEGDDVGLLIAIAVNVDRRRSVACCSLERDTHEDWILRVGFGLDGEGVGRLVRADLAEGLPIERCNASNGTPYLTKVTVNQRGGRVVLLNVDGNETVRG